VIGFAGLATMDGCNSFLCITCLRRVGEKKSGILVDRSEAYGLTEITVRLLIPHNLRFLMRKRKNPGRTLHSE
jgi:hypothetical protein